MSDVFISYARASEEQARRVEEALRSGGYQVWRDSELPAHRTYAEVIEERLKSAKAVVVLWSAEAAKSQWVRAEADAARELGTLVQASVDGTMPPIPFNQIQCADIKGWKGEEGHAGWRKLAASVAALAGKAEQERPPSQPKRQRTSVCVLPFANMSGDAEQEYFSDGISEDITTDLSKVSALEVIARNTAFQFKGQSVDVGEIARKLGVSHVLEGSVRKAGNRVRITAQLIDGDTGGHIWAERYDRDLEDIFAIQDELSKAIVEALKVRLLPQEKKALGDRCTCNPEAYDLYLMARQYWITGDFGDRRREDRVIRLCKRAVEIDPEYPQAWALMALAQANLFYAYSGRNETDDGLEAAERALALDRTIATAYLPRAWHLALAGRQEEAAAEIEKALKLDPDSWEANKEAARIYYRQGKLTESIRLLERATKLADWDFHSLGMLTAGYLAQGDLERVRECARGMVRLTEEVLSHDPDNGAALAFEALSYAALGEFDRARDRIERALLLDPDNLYMRYNLAWPLIAFFKDQEAALKVLEPALAKAGRNLISLAAADRNLDSLRSDPRFQEMLTAAQRRLGMVSATTTPSAAAEARPRS
ncbi:MAG TPA: TIR domain-containing protein [Sphingomicrobium sp.]|nr:TIR domain-containing protein [Sphingomicrobium sp.]